VNCPYSAAERMMLAELVMRGAFPSSVGLVMEGFNRHHWPMGLGGRKGEPGQGGLHARSAPASHFLTESSWLKVQAANGAV
jgi:hypothetical protein